MEGRLPKIRTAVFLLQHSGVIWHIPFTLLLKKMSFSSNLQDKVLVYKCYFTPSGSNEQKDCPLPLPYFVTKWQKFQPRWKNAPRTSRGFYCPIMLRNCSPAQYSKHQWERITVLTKYIYPEIRHKSIAAVKWKKTNNNNKTMAIQHCSPRKRNSCFKN